MWQCRVTRGVVGVVQTVTNQTLQHSGPTQLERGVIAMAQAALKAERAAASKVGQVHVAAGGTPQKSPVPGSCIGSSSFTSPGAFCCCFL